MRRVLAVVLLAAVALATPTVATAAPTTQVIQGSVLRLVSAADWDAAAGLLPGQPVRWDVTVSADAPDPGTVQIAISATGDALLLVDASLCAEAWTDTGCPAGATPLRAAWSIPRDGVEVRLAEMADTDVAHLRLAITLDPADAAGSTEVRVHASGAGETVVVAPDGGLATTGASPWPAWSVGAAAVLLGVVAVLVGRRRAAHSDEGSGR